MHEEIISVDWNNRIYTVAVSIKKSAREWIVCLHGIQSNKQLFTDLLTQPFLQQYSLLALDLVGFGSSCKPRDFSYDIAEQAQIVQKILSKLAVERMHMIGHSLGGTVATHLLTPLVKSIISFTNLEGNLTVSDSGLTKTVSSYSFDEFKNTYPHIKEDIQNSSEPSSQLRSTWLATVPDYVFYHTARSIISHAETGELLRLYQRTPCPTLYILGEKNVWKETIIPASSKIAVIPQSGHFMLIDNPQATFTNIQSFLQSVSFRE